MTSELFDNLYRFIKDLGEGGFGRVFMAQEEKTHLLVAIKQLNNEDSNDQEDLIYEMQMISRFFRPNIVNFR